MPTAMGIIIVQARTPASRVVLLPFLGNSTHGERATAGELVLVKCRPGMLLPRLNPEMKCYLGNDDLIKDVTMRLRIMRKLLSL